MNMIFGRTKSGVSSAATAVTYNGNPSYETIGKPHLDYYGGVTRQTRDTDIQRLSQACVDSDLRLALATFFQKRDCRGGSGERKPFVLSLAQVPEQLRHKLYLLIPEYGYWKDLNKLARTIPHDQNFIADIFATQLLKNILTFTSDINEVSDRNLEKWLPTESQQDDKSWHAVNKIIKAFNTNLQNPIQLRYNVANRVVEDVKRRITKFDNKASIEYTVGGTLETKSDSEKVQALTKKYQHLLDKASNLPIILTQLKRTGYRKWCAFARGYYDIVEHFKSTGEWDLITYSSVPSIAFDRTKKQFEKHDHERFQEFIGSVKNGDAKINVGRLMPYELLAQSSNEVRDEQWKQIVNETRDFYSEVFFLDKDNPFHPKNSIHVADVSGSMLNAKSKPLPIHVSLSLTFLMSEVSGRPLYTFSGEPRKYAPTWKNLTEAQEMVNDDNYDTNFRGLIDKIYEDCMLEADQKKVAPSEVIPGSIYIYTDGGFDTMCYEQPTTAVDYIEKKFGKFKKVPMIIFWNVAGNVKDFTVTTNHKGVVQLAGFSKDLYKVFTRLTSIDEITPEGLFSKAVLTERYQPVLKVYDDWIQEIE